MYRASEHIENKSNQKISVDYLKNLPANEYILGAGDVLNVKVSRDYPELEVNKKINREGTIILPKILKVYVEGLTKKELTDLLNIAYKEFVKFPSVEIEIRQYRPVRVYVDGEVSYPGLQTLSGAFTIGSTNENENNNDAKIENTFLTNYFPTVFDAIRSAGGITPFSNLEEVEIIRINSLSNGGERKKAILNFASLINLGDSSQNIRIYDGDLIKIKKSKKANIFQLSKAAKSNLNPRFVNVFITGRINSPGNKRLTKSSSLNDAISVAGGTKVLKGKVSFIRFNNDGNIEQRKIRYSKNHKRGSYSNPYLAEGDIIFIDNSFISSTNEVIKEITSPLSGIFSTYGLIKVLSE